MNHYVKIFWHVVVHQTEGVNSVLRTTVIIFPQAEYYTEPQIWKLLQIVFPRQTSTSSPRFAKGKLRLLARSLRSLACNRLHFEKKSDSKWDLERTLSVIILFFMLSWHHQKYGVQEYGQKYRHVPTSDHHFYLTPRLDDCGAIEITKVKLTFTAVISTLHRVCIDIALQEIQ